MIYNDDLYKIVCQTDGKWIKNSNGLAPYACVYACANADGQRLLDAHRCVWEKLFDRAELCGSLLFFFAVKIKHADPCEAKRGQQWPGCHNLSTSW